MIEIPLRIESMANLREHHMKRYRRWKREHKVVAETLGYLIKTRPALPCTVNLVRIGPRKLDGDNCQGGFKAVRDAVADWLEVNDNDPRVHWQYEQRIGRPYACRIEFL